MKNIIAPVLAITLVCHVFGEEPGFRPDLECKGTRYFRDLNDCSKFYKCIEHDTHQSRSEYMQFQCPFGTLYDPSKSSCNQYEIVMKNHPHCTLPLVDVNPRSNEIIDFQDHFPPSHVFQDDSEALAPRKLQSIRSSLLFNRPYVNIPYLAGSSDLQFDETSQYASNHGNTA